MVQLITGPNTAWNTYWCGCNCRRSRVLLKIRIWTKILTDMRYTVPLMMSYQLIYDASSQDFIHRCRCRKQCHVPVQTACLRSIKNKSAFSETVQAQPLNVAPAVFANAQIYLVTERFSYHGHPMANGIDQ